MGKMVGYVASSVVVAAAVAAGWGGTALAGVRWPVAGAVIADFDPPEPDWLPGHRGIDLATESGAAVISPREGVVLFTGRVAGTPVVVVGHGSLRSTYQPVEGSLPVGSVVTGGQSIGRMVDGPSHCSSPCLHWGARVGERYVDPRILLGATHVALLPTAD